eukprot:scaffold24440_cov113-Isochrysis_galbana.AAC.2
MSDAAKRPAASGSCSARKILGRRKGARAAWSGRRPRISRVDLHACRASRVSTATDAHLHAWHTCGGPWKSSTNVWSPCTLRGAKACSFLWVPAFANGPVEVSRNGSLKKSVSCGTAPPLSSSFANVTQSFGTRLFGRSGPVRHGGKRIATHVRFEHA